MVAGLGSTAAVEPVLVRIRGRGASAVHDVVLSFEAGSFSGLGSSSSLALLRNTQVHVLRGARLLSCA